MSVCNGFGKSLISIAIVVFVICRGASASDELTGEMAKLSYLLGKWTCTDNLRDSMPIPAVATYEVGPRNTIHGHWAYAFEDVEADSYYGYNFTAHEYYKTTAGSGGSSAFASSSDGVTYSGTSRGPNGSEKSTVAIRAPSADSLEVRSQTIYNGNVLEGFEDCSRQR
jgi:hypothetical protein